MLHAKRQIIMSTITQVFNHVLYLEKTIYIIYLLYYIIINFADMPTITKQQQGFSKLLFDALVSMGASTAMILFKTENIMKREFADFFY